MNKKKKKRLSKKYRKNEKILKNKTKIIISIIYKILKMILTYQKL